MGGLTIVRLNGVHINEWGEEQYRLTYTPAFAAAAPANGQDDERVKTLCDVASRLFCEISKIEGFKRTYGIAHDIFDFGLPDVLPVLVVNAVMHGNVYDPSKKVQVSYTHEEPNASARHGKFTLTVSDQGAGFNYSKLRAAARSAQSTAKNFNHYRSSEQRPPNSIGLGLFNVLWYATRVGWNNTGNEVTVTKFLQPRYSVA